MSYKIDIKELAKSNVHFGHKTSRYHPDMAPYIWGKKNKIHLIDLTKTAFLIEHACKQLEDLLAEGGQVLWLGTKKQAQSAIKQAAQDSNSPCVYHRWIGGTLTNYDQVKKAVTRLLHLRDVVAKPLPHYKKKEIVMLKKGVERLEKNVGGIVSLKGAPAVLVVVDAKREETAIIEAKRTGVPVIALVDTNTRTNMVDLIIPCNDDSPLSIALIVSKLSAAAQAGIAKYKSSDKAAQEAKAPAAVSSEASSEDATNPQSADSDANKDGRPPRRTGDRPARPAGATSGPRRTGDRPVRTGADAGPRKPGNFGPRKPNTSGPKKPTS